MMRVLSRIVDAVIVTQPPSAPFARRWILDEAHDHARTLPWQASMTANFDAALARAQQVGATVLVTGSFHTVGDAMARLQVNPMAG
jgi:dihydrofolate synthase/folylpolyglutamate synthase